MSSMPKLLKLKDYITLIGTTCGLIALMCAVIGTREFISVGFFLCTITILTDLLDGYVARRTGTVNEIGKELDSLSDSMTFGIAPAVLSYQAYRTGTYYDLVLAAGCVIFAIGAILRLARFNISTDSPGYTGVPTPVSGLLAILFFYTNYFYATALGGPGPSGTTHPFSDITYYAVPFIMILIGWFNITTLVSFKDKDKVVYILVIALTPFALILGLIGLLLGDALSSVNYVVSVSLFIFFLSTFLTAILIIVRGFFIKKPTKNEEKNK